MAVSSWCTCSEISQYLRQETGGGNIFVVCVLFSRFSLIPHTSTTVLPQVGIGGSLVVESRKNGHCFRGIIWWDYLVGSTEFSRPPTHPPVAAPPRVLPRALGSDHPAPHRGAPFAARSLCFVAAGQRIETRSIERFSSR
jgi:hypothetical protein